ncbi:hypothetical protein RJ641_023936, partial [Dillenia turbinata]
MRIFGWMQSKFGGGQGCKKPNVVSAQYPIKQEPRKDEFRDWPHGLLTIGTFGTNEMVEASGTQNSQEDPSTSEEDLTDFTPEEVGQLQKELMKLLSRKSSSKAQKDVSDLPLDRFLNCPSSLEVDRRNCDTFCNDSDQCKEAELERTISVIIDRCKEVCAEKNSKNAIGKRSISFLLKKMFVCRSGFAPAPSLRDTLQESRMEKLLRTMLHKKIYPQNASCASSMKKYLGDRQVLEKENEDEKKREKTKDGSKWVKTDSE